MEEALNETYDDLPAQPPRTMIYQTKAMEKDGEVISWTTEKNSQPDSQQSSTSSTDVYDVWWYEPSLSILLYGGMSQVFPSFCMMV